MKPWKSRPLEIANLLNPAFTSLLLFDAASAYKQASSEGIPYPLAFLVLPIVLHKNTREKLPYSKSTRMHMWLQTYSEVRVGFSGRVKRLKPFTQEGLLFGIQQQILRFTEAGGIVSTSSRYSRYSFTQDTEPYACRQKAKLVGRWFSSTGSVKNIFLMWGIRP